MFKREDEEKSKRLLFLYTLLLCIHIYICFTFISTVDDFTHFFTKTHTQIVFGILMELNIIRKKSSDYKHISA